MAGLKPVQEKNLTPIQVPILCVPVRSNGDLKAWQERLQLNYEEAASQLGVDRSTYAAYLSGKSRATGLPTSLPRSISLAAMAVEVGLHRLLPAPVTRKKQAAR